MEIGDLIYFVKPHYAKYSSGVHNFKLCTPYKVVGCSSTWTLTASIEDLETGKSHFITSDALSKTIDHKLFLQLDREHKLNELLKCR